MSIFKHRQFALTLTVAAVFLWYETIGAPETILDSLALVCGNAIIGLLYLFGWFWDRRQT